jgi:inner membrane protein
MLLRTHLAITIFGILALISLVEYKVVFVAAALVATLIPDIDSQNSTLGQKKFMKLFQIFTKHRGMIHSFTFCVLLTLFFALFVPIVALGFFLGYALHLLADSFSVEGITPFWPYKKKSSWKVSTGHKSETTVLVFFIIADLILFFLVSGIF